MITINGITRNCTPESGCGFSYRELWNEALRRGYPVGKSMTKGDLMKILEEKEVLHRQDFIAFVNSYQLYVANLTDDFSLGGATEQDGKKDLPRKISLPYFPHIVGVTRDGLIVVLETRSDPQRVKTEILPHLHLFDSQLREIRDFVFSESESIWEFKREYGTSPPDLQRNALPELTGNKLVFVDGSAFGASSSSAARGFAQRIKVLDIKTFEVTTLADSGNWMAMSASDNHVIAHDTSSKTLTLWDLGNGKVIASLSTKEEVWGVGGGRHRAPSIKDLYLIDRRHFSVHEDNFCVFTLVDTDSYTMPCEMEDATSEVCGGYTEVLVEKKLDPPEWRVWKREKSTLSYGRVNEKLVVGDFDTLHVYDISGDSPEFSHSIPLPYGSPPHGLMFEMSSSRILLRSDSAHKIVCVDIEDERVIHSRPASGMQRCFPLLFEEGERQRFLKLVSESISESVPLAVVGVIEKFI